MRNIRHKTWALDRPRVIQDKQKNLAYILSNFSGDLSFLFCSNTLIHAPECRKGEAYPMTPLESHTFGVSSSFSTYSYSFAT